MRSCSSSSRSSWPSWSSSSSPLSRSSSGPDLPADGWSLQTYRWKIGEQGGHKECVACIIVAQNEIHICLSASAFPTEFGFLQGLTKDKRKDPAIGWELKISPFRFCSWTSSSWPYSRSQHQWHWGPCWGHCLSLLPSSLSRLSRSYPFSRQSQGWLFYNLGVYINLLCHFGFFSLLLY